MWNVPHRTLASALWQWPALNPAALGFGLPSYWFLLSVSENFVLSDCKEGTWSNWVAVKHFPLFIVLRVEPALTRIKEDRKRIILPAIDNIKYNTFEVQQYANAAHGYNWGLWCMYIIPPQDWLDKGDESAPIR